MTFLIWPKRHRNPMPNPKEHSESSGPAGPLLVERSVQDKDSLFVTAGDCNFGSFQRFLVSPILY